MNIGIVTTWFERGGAYVSRQYRDLLKNDFNVFIYARGGEQSRVEILFGMTPLLRGQSELYFRLRVRLIGRILPGGLPRIKSKLFYLTSSNGGFRSSGARNWV